MKQVVTWSFSALKEFKTCPRKYHANRVLKLYPHQDTDATIYGKVVHKAAEDYIRDGTALPEGLGQFQRLLDSLRNIPGEKFCELEMALLPDCSPCDFGDDARWVRGIADLVIINGGKAWVVDYKGLALDTKLPTPTGFTTMGDVRVGDVLFAESGEQCKVIGKSEVKHLRCYKITFDDTSSVVCDEEHLWKTVDGSVIGVQDLMGKRNAKQRINVPKISVAAPLALPDIVLPIDPYVLGLWLADGKRSSGEISKPDTFLWEEIQRRGYHVDMTTGGSKSCPTRTVKGLRTQLTAAGLLRNKHIPEVFLRAGYTQRLDLLRGLMDGDGSANPTRKQAVFSNTDEALSRQVAELLHSLGQRPLVNAITATGFGLTTTAYPVSFRPLGINPFLLPRKASRVLHSWGAGQSAYRYAIGVEEIPTVPTQCIMVDSPDHTFLCTEAMIPTHNTGKANYPDISQLELMALMVFAHYPEVETVHAALLFVHHNKLIPAMYYRKDEATMWRKWKIDVGAIERSHEGDVWNPNPNGLCRKWCNVDYCEHRG